MAVASVPASANTLTVFVSAAQIITATNALTGAFSGGCGAGTGALNSCGIWEVGFVSDTSAVGSFASTAQTVTTFPQYWSAPTALFTGTTADGIVTGGAGTTERLITSDSTAPTGNYTNSNNSVTATAAGAIFGASDTTDGFTFRLTTNAVAGGADSIVLLVRAVGITAGTGAEGSVKGTANITVSSTLTSTATPEPSSVLFMVSGIAAIGFGKLRLRRR